MGITNTISELSKYFYEWHKNKYEEIHNSIISEIENLKSDISDIETKFNNIYNEIHDKKTGILKNIDTLTVQVNTLIHDMSIVQSDKADKSSLQTWSTYDTVIPCNKDGNRIPNIAVNNMTLCINTDIRMARLVIKDMIVWNPGEKFYSSKYYTPSNDSTPPTTATAMKNLSENQKVYYKVPSNYTPAGQNASSSIAIGTAFVGAGDGLIEFKLDYQFNGFKNINVSIMWAY